MNRALGLARATAGQAHSNDSFTPVNESRLQGLFLSPPATEDPSVTTHRVTRTESGARKLSFGAPT